MYGVRRASDDAIALELFSEERFRDDVHEILFRQKGPLPEASIDAAVDRAMRIIRSELTFHDLRLKPQEYRARADLVGAIPDAVIAQAVERVLRQGRSRPHRMAELLYVMAVRGGINHNREGWDGADNVLNWIKQRYPHVDMPELVIPKPTREPIRLNRANFRPSTVLKRGNQTVPFSMPQFRKSVQAALYGRNRAAAKATLVVHYVLQEIEGQRIVHSSQLAAGALAGLRRIDDIAYLRWAMVVKDISSIRTFTEEAKDLIVEPSRPLALKFKPR